jgi:expansin (peptidoglycan-binding protein)
VTNKTGGDKNHLDMTPDTWDKLTGNAPGSGPGGVDGIEWQFVPCPIAKTEPLWIHMHGGASQYWPAATVENARRRTTSLEFSDDEGTTWVSTTRDTNNFFKAPGTLSSSTAWVKVTSHTGSIVVVKDVNLSSGVVTKATGNYA